VLRLGRGEEKARATHPPPARGEVYWHGSGRRPAPAVPVHGHRGTGGAAVHHGAGLRPAPTVPVQASGLLLHAGARCAPAPCVLWRTAATVAPCPRLHLLSKHNTPSHARPCAPHRCKHVALSRLRGTRRLHRLLASRKLQCGKGRCCCFRHHHTLPRRLTSSGTGRVAPSCGSTPPNPPR